MWFRVVTVVIVSSLVSSVISVTDLEDNMVPEDNLQDLTVRTKKSPVAEVTEKSESKSDAQLTAVLTEDIKRKIEDLKELKNAYHKVEADFFGSKSQTLRSSIEEPGSESKTHLRDSSEEPDNESVRIARQYFPTSYSGNQYQDKNYDGKKGMFPGNPYSNGKYQSVSSHAMGSYGDRDAPYIAQYNPSSRTFGAFALDFNKGHDVNPEATIHLPQISIKPVELELEHPIKPVELEHPSISVHPAPSPINLVPATLPEHKPVNFDLPASLPTITVSEHKPYEASVHSVKPESKVPLYYEKKEIGTPGSFFSKQIIYGPSNFGEGSYYPSTPYSTFPHGDAHSQPGYSSYPAGYAYGGSPSYWYASDKDGYSSPGYSSYPDAHANYNYGPAYSPGYPYPQGQSYYPAGGNFRSDIGLSDQFLRYQDELDSLLSQFFREDSSSAGGVAVVSPSFGNHSSVGQLEKEIEFEQKKIKALQEELNTPQGSKDTSGVSQSFVNWLSGEIDAVYSKWIHLKDDITKPKQDSGPSTKEDLKTENVKA